MQALQVVSVWMRLVARWSPTAARKLPLESADGWLLFLQEQVISNHHHRQGRIRACVFARAGVPARTMEGKIQQAALWAGVAAAPSSFCPAAWTSVIVY